MQAENRLLTSLLWCACSYLIIKREKTSHFTDKNTRNKKKKKSVIWLRSHRLARGSKLTNYSLHVISLPWLLRAVSRNQRVLFHYSYVLLLHCIIMLQSMAQHTLLSRHFPAANAWLSQSWGCFEYQGTGRELTGWLAMGIKKKTWG